MALKEDAAFDSFVAQAQAMLGNDLSRDWLLEIWSGADGDANRALNHVLDSPEDKIRRGGGGSPTKDRSAYPTDKKPHKTKKPKKRTPQPQQAPQAPPAPPPLPPLAAATWDEDYYEPPPPPHQPQQYYQAPPPHLPPPVSYQQTPQPQQAGMTPAGYAPPQAPPSLTQQPIPTQPLPLHPQTAPGQHQQQLTPLMQQQLYIQQTQQSQLLALKGALDNVLATPSLLQSPPAMKNLQDALFAALEAPNATLLLEQRAQQSAQTGNFIQLMQNQISSMLQNPQVATNPELLQHLNTQMNQLRLITMQHASETQILNNPATAVAIGPHYPSGGGGGGGGNLPQTMYAGMMPPPSQQQQQRSMTPIGGTSGTYMPFSAPVMNMPQMNLSNPNLAMMPMSQSQVHTHPFSLLSF